MWLANLGVECTMHKIVDWALVGVKRKKNDMLAWECMMHEIVDLHLLEFKGKKIDWEIMNGRKM